MATGQQIARLKAGAKGGTTGVKEFDAAQAGERASRDEAIRQITREGQAIDAPAALTAHLAASVARPAAQSIANLGEYAGTAAMQRAVDKSGSDTYMSEAQAAIPVVDAYANYDLAQRLRMLAASRTSTTGANKPLTDTQLKSRLLGAAQQQRDAAAAKGQQDYQAALTYLQGLSKGGVYSTKARSAGELGNTAEAMGPLGIEGPVGPTGGSLGVVGPAGPQTPAAQPGNAPQPVQHVYTPVQAQQNFQDELQQRNAARQTALANVLNTLSGPGITQEATQIGVQAGIDPNRLYGLLTPNVDAAYVSAMRREGLYKDPGSLTVHNELLDRRSAGRQLGLSGDDYNAATRAKFYDWHGDSRLTAAFKAWAKQNPSEAKGSIDEQHTAFEKDDTGGSFRTNVIDNVLASARSALRNHVSFQQFQLDAAAYYSGFDNEVKLALTMVAPLFQAAEVSNTRTVTPGAYNYPGQ